MAISLNSATNGIITGSGATLTISSSSGNLIIVSLYNAATSGGTVTSITDNKSNTYVSTGNNPLLNTGGGSMEIWYAAGATAGVTTITVNYSPNTGNFQITAYDCSGAHATQPLGSVSSVYNPVVGVTTIYGPAASWPLGGGIAVSVVAANTNVNSISAPWTKDNSAFTWGFAHDLAASAGSYVPVWGFNSVTGNYDGLTAMFVSQQQTGFTNVRMDMAQTVTNTTSVVTPGIQTSVGDLVVVVAACDNNVGTTNPTFTDSKSNTFVNVSGMHPIHNGAGFYDVYVGYCVLANAGSGHTFTFNFPSDGGVVLTVLAVDPTGTVTFHNSGQGTTSANTAHTAASCTPTATDFIIAALIGGTDFTNPTTYTSNAGWLSGSFMPDCATYENVAVQFQLSAAGGSTTDNFTTNTNATTTEIILAFSLPAAPTVGNQGLGMCPDSQFHWLGGDDN